MTRQWTAQDVLEIARGFQAACVMTAAAELDLFDVLAETPPMTAEALAEKIQADPRATAMLADALTAMELLAKDGGRYSLAPGVARTLTEAGDQSVAAMARHSACCLRSWAELARAVKTGRSVERGQSIRGAERDRESFIEAMDNVSRPSAGPLVAAIGPPKFDHLLDVGGGPGTWTIAFLRAMPTATATLLDLPEVIPIARRHVAAAGMSGRVSFAAGDFNADPALPGGADLAWVSAIVHQNSRVENRELFAKVHAALADGGQILIRDVVMDESRTSPPQGAMFAVNMLVNTPGGGTFTFAELGEDLRSAGFADPVLLHRDEFMNSVVQAKKA